MKIDPLVLAHKIHEEAIKGATQTPLITAITAVEMLWPVVHAAINQENPDLLLQMALDELAAKL